MNKKISRCKVGLFFLFGVGFFVSAIAHEKRLVIVDVSYPDVFNDCHIQNAINIPFDKVGKQVDTFAHDDEIVLYCTNYLCSASTEAYRKLQAHGFKNVSVYKGGIAEWYQQGKVEAAYKTEGACTAAFLNDAVEKIAIENSEITVITAEQLQQKIETYGLKNVHIDISIFEKIHTWLTEFKRSVLAVWHAIV